MKRTLQTKAIPTIVARVISSLTVIGVSLFFASTSQAQGDFHLQPQQESGQLELTGSFHLEQDARTGYLVLQADIPEGSYIYSLTQEGSGSFKPDNEPVVVEQDPVFKNRTEKHKQDVRFFIPLQLAEGADPAELAIQMRFNGQLCSEAEGTCMPVQDKVINAEFGGYYQRVAEQTSGDETIRR